MEKRARKSVRKSLVRAIRIGDNGEMRGMETERERERGRVSDKDVDPEPNVREK